MDYQVLARKWRPRRFKDMVGQEHILRMLSNALEQKRIHHAYLFTGTRGVGKTTIARIFAKCLNCETGITAQPCEQCATCQAIDAGRFLDLFEIDAASRTKVEDTRELLDNVLYPPTQGRFKVYLIDEVHMLSNHSFNALLKTLEEPPEHVKFLLATTDPKRLPITILSRCLQFHLKRINLQQIAEQLQHICQAENISSDLPALEKIAKAADGSMRDAQSLLDQAIAYGKGAVLTADVNEMLGSIAQDDLLPLLTALAQQDGKQILSMISQLAERGPDFNQLLEELISLLHQLALLQIVPEKEAHTDLRTLSTTFMPEDIQVYYQIALLGRRDLALAPTPLQGFEMTLLRMLAFKPAASKPASEQPPAKTQIKISEKPATPIAEKTTATTATKATVANNTHDWREILPKLELSGMAYALAANSSLVQLTENQAELALAVSHQPMLHQKLIDRIEEGLSRYLQRPIKLTMTITAAEITTPLKQQQQEQEQHLNQAKQAFAQEPVIKKLIEVYDATLEVSPVTE